MVASGGAVSDDLHIIKTVVEYFNTFVKRFISFMYVLINAVCVELL